MSEQDDVALCLMTASILDSESIDKPNEHAIAQAAAIRSVLARLEVAEADAERIDWISQEAASYSVRIEPAWDRAYQIKILPISDSMLSASGHDSVRAAIDAARRK